MKKSMKALSLSLGLACLPLSAGGWDSCCNLDGCWEIGAEALYWKASTCEWQYGTSNSAGVLENSTIRDTHSVNAGYDWGLRIFGSYISQDCCKFLTLDWTYLRTTDIASEARVLAFGSTFERDFTAKMRTRYNRVNLRGGYFVHRSCNLDFYVYAGVRWIDFDLRRKISGINSADDTAFSLEKSELSGGALEFGLGGLYRFDCGLNLVANVGPVAAIGDRKHTFTSENIGTSETIKYPNRTICFPGLDFRIGLNTAFECDCFTVTAEIGYELNYYFNALTTIIAYRPNNNANLSACRNIGFGGPYLSVGVRF